MMQSSEHLMWMQYYNSSSPDIVTLDQNSSYGLRSITFNASSNKQNSTITAGGPSHLSVQHPRCSDAFVYIDSSRAFPDKRCSSPFGENLGLLAIAGYISGGDVFTDPTCLLNITFITASPPPPPPSPPAPAQLCTGFIPCYCQVSLYFPQMVRHFYLM